MSMEAVFYRPVITHALRSQCDIIQAGDIKTLLCVLFPSNDITGIFLKIDKTLEAGSGFPTVFGGKQIKTAEFYLIV